MMDNKTVSYIVAALLILVGGVSILYGKSDNKPLKLLSFILVASMIVPVNDSHLAWVVELILIVSISSIDLSIIKHNRWYIMFVLWSIFTLTYSDNPIRGIPGIVMYVFPLSYYLLASIAIKKKNDIKSLFSFVSNSNNYLLILCIIPLFYGLPSTYYGMTICTIPAVLFLETKKRKYIVLFLICLLPAIIMVKRTPILGIAAAMIVFTTLLYRWKAIIPCFIVVVIGIATFLYVPNLKEKMFYEDVDMSFSGFSDNSAENINMNGRGVFWMKMIDKYYRSYPYFGAGQGTVKAFMQSDENEYRNIFSLMHNDWLLILCEMGIVGVSLLLLFFVGILRKCIKYSSKVYPKELRIMSAVCAATVVSTMIFMFLANCMNSLSFSTLFVFYAFFVIYVQNYKKGIKWIQG